MPRRKLSEFAAKKIVAQELGISYEGWGVSYDTRAKDIAKIKAETTFVVKVDQAVKGRFKKGLVVLDVPRSAIESNVRKLHAHGFDHFVVEPYKSHKSAEERYLSVASTREGVTLSLSTAGGVDIESNPESIETYLVDDKTKWDEIAVKTGLSESYLRGLVETFLSNHFSFMEINPYLIDNGAPVLLDLAVEVDDAASLIVGGWKADDLRNPPRDLSGEEKTVVELGEKSPASFSFQMINPNGALFVLLSGGGASVTVCDEIYSAGYGEQLANYGEYSGNPTTEETYIYTTALLRSLLASKAKKKALFIGGAVANFTDIAKTFTGITQAIEEYGDRLKAQKVRVVVRRGGPNQEAGLADIREVLDKYDLNAAVYDPSTPIDAAVRRLVKEIAK